IGVALREGDAEPMQVAHQQVAKRGLARAARSLQRGEGRPPAHACLLRSVFPTPEPPAIRRTAPAAPPAPCTAQASGKQITRKSRSPSRPGVPSHRSTRTTCTVQTVANTAATVLVLRLPVAMSKQVSGGTMAQPIHSAAEPRADAAIIVACQPGRV